MAVTSKFEGILIGHDEYTKEGKTTHTYYALITQKQDPETKLYEACELVAIRESEENAIKKADMKYGAEVTFNGEFVKMKNGAFMAYSGIEVVKPCAKTVSK